MRSAIIVIQREDKKINLKNGQMSENQQTAK